MTILNKVGFKFDCVSGRYRTGETVQRVFISHGIDFVASFRLRATFEISLHEYLLPSSSNTLSPLREKETELNPGLPVLPTFFAQIGQMF